MIPLKVGDRVRSPEGPSVRWKDGRWVEAPPRKAYHEGVVLAVTKRFVIIDLADDLETEVVLQRTAPFEVLPKEDDRADDAS